MSGRDGYWIQRATSKHPGKFTAKCRALGYGGVTAACIAKERNSRDATTRREANLAAVLRHMAARRKQHH